MGEPRCRFLLLYGKAFEDKEFQTISMIWGVLHDVSYLLAELRIRTGARPTAKEKTSKVMEIAGKDSSQLKDERK